MEFLPLIVECHKRENWELYISLCNGEIVFCSRKFYSSKVSLVFVSQDNWSGVVFGEGMESVWAALRKTLLSLPHHKMLNIYFNCLHAFDKGKLPFFIPWRKSNQGDKEVKHFLTIPNKWAFETRGMVIRFLIHCSKWGPVSSSSFEEP